MFSRVNSKPTNQCSSFCICFDWNWLFWRREFFFEKQKFDTNRKKIADVHRMDDLVRRIQVPGQNKQIFACTLCSYRGSHSGTTNRHVRNVHLRKMFLPNQGQIGWASTPPHDLFCSSKVIIKPDQLHSNNVADNFNWRQRTEGGALMFLEDNGKDKIQCVACNRFYKNRYELKRHITRNRCKPPTTAKPLLFWSCFTLNKKTPHAQCLKITEKVEFNFASEASNVYIC